MLSSWKTTLAGAVIAGLYAWENSGSLDAKRAAIVFAIAALGALSKDA